MKHSDLYWDKVLAICFLLSFTINGCRHWDRDSTLEITVMTENETRLDGVNVQLNYYKSNIELDNKTTDENGEAFFVLEDWGNGSAWGTTLVPLLTSGDDTLEIQEPKRIQVYQKGDQYDGEDFKETIYIK